MNFGADDREPEAVDGLAEQARRLAAGEVSSELLVGQALDRIAACQARLGAFRVVRVDAARLEAADADRRLAAGQRRPLLGVPVAVKDDVDLAGETTPFGCAGAHRPRTRDSDMVAGLRGAGAIVVGKTTTSQFGQWPTGEAAGFASARNPWDPAFTPGGSSAGSAVAVAGGLVAGAVGSDGLGSIRVPAAWTSLVGLKPQRGRVSTLPHIDPFYGLTVYGPLTRSVGDAGLLLDVLAGTGTRHHDAADRADPGRLRVALSFRTPFGVPSAVDPQIRAAVLRLAERLEALGHRVAPGDPNYGLVGLSALPRGTSGVADWLERIPDAEPEPSTRTDARLGRLLGRRLLGPARRMEPRLRSRVAAIFAEADVVLTPTTAGFPLPIGALAGCGWWMSGHLSAAAAPFAWAWNVLGWPAMSVPAGFGAGGLPIGAQLLGRPDDEATLLALGAQLEADQGWTARRPPLTFGRDEDGTRVRGPG